MTTPKASKVTVTKADGSVEIQNAYTPVQVARVVNGKKPGQKKRYRPRRRKSS